MSIINCDNCGASIDLDKECDDVFTLSLVGKVAELETHFNACGWCAETILSPSQFKRYVNGESSFIRHF